MLSRSVERQSCLYKSELLMLQRQYCLVLLCRYVNRSPSSHLSSSYTSMGTAANIGPLVRSLFIVKYFTCIPQNSQMS